MRRSLLLIHALLILACAGAKDDGGDTGGAADLYDGTACQDLMACYAAASPDDFAASVETYGPDGSCWSDEALAVQCDGTCAELYSDAYLAWPDEPACGGTTPDDWPFDEGVYDLDILDVPVDTCGQFQDPEDIEEVERIADETDAWRASYEVYPAFSLGLADCTLTSGASFECTATLGELTADYAGSFLDRRTAELTQSGEVDGCEVEMEARLTYEGP
ncbi:MAG: hypothetical protein H6739_25010 [Alphaproteobacteria bacterium]|nr:hypothetical protein [Alphaproteobacteria bacterium]